MKFTSDHLNVLCDVAYSLFPEQRSNLIFRMILARIQCTVSTVWMISTARLTVVEVLIHVNNVTNSSTVMRKTSAAVGTQIDIHMTKTSKSVVRQVRYLRF